MKLEFLEARDLPDAWFQCIYRLLETGREYIIDRGSYEGQIIFRQHSGLNLIPILSLRTGHRKATRH